MPVGELPGLLRHVHEIHAELADKGSAAHEEPPRPAVPVKKSVTDDFIYCLEDGLPFKSLKRHLRAKYDMSPDDYRRKWGLPADYPMVSRNYAKERSQLAKRMGLGQSRR